MKTPFAFFFALIFSLVAQAAPTTLSFNGNLAGTPSITSLVLIVYSASCNLYQTANYGSVTMDAGGNFSVTIDGSTGTYLGNANGAGYTTLADIFNTNNNSIIGGGGCTIDGTTASWNISVTVNGTPLAGSVPVNAVPFAVQAQSAVSTRRIAGFPVSTTTPSSNQVLQYIGGFWTPTTLAAGGVTSVSADSPLSSTGGTTPTLSLAGLASLGATNQILGMNAGATAYEYKTVSAGTGIDITQGANSLSIAANGDLSSLAGLSGTGFVKRNGASNFVTSSSASLTADVSGVLPIANGGTNSSATLSNGRVMISSGNRIVEHTALTDSLPMRTDAAGLPTTGTLDVASEVTGTLGVPNGGTGTTTGSITGTTALNLSAGGTNQNVTLAPTGTGSVVLGTKVGIGTTAAANHLSIYQSTNTHVRASIGVSGTGGAQIASLNFMSRGGQLAPQAAGTKGYQLGVTGDSYSGGANQMYLDYFDAGTVSSVMTISPGYTAVNTALKSSYYNPATYTSSSSSSAFPPVHHIEVGNNDGPLDRGATTVYSVAGGQSAYMGIVGTNSGNTPNMVFGQQTGTTAYVERMRLTPAGRLAIGQTGASTTLDVFGSTRSRAYYTTCSTACTNVTLSLSDANTFYFNASAAVGFAAANASNFANYGGMEFTIIVCSSSGTNSVTFGGNSSGFATGVSWSSVPSGYCTSQKFVIVSSTPGYIAIPVGPVSSVQL